MIAGAGELIVDCFQEGRELRREAGGAPFNALSGAALLGSEASFYGAVGGDVNGRFMRESIARIPFRRTFVDVLPDRLTTYTEVLVKKGERSFLFHNERGADHVLSFDHFRNVLEEGTTLVHLGSLFLPFPEGKRFLEETVRYVREREGVLLSFDVNYRPGIHPEGEGMREMFLPICHEADLLKLTEEELYLLTGEKDFEKGLRALARPGQLLALTLGKDGSMACLDGKILRVPSPKVLRPVDTTGAGDAFMAYLLHAFGERKPRDLGEEEMKAIFLRANACGALATQAKGALASFPRKEDIERFLL